MEAKKDKLQSELEKLRKNINQAHVESENLNNQLSQIKKEVKGLTLQRTKLLDNLVQQRVKLFMHALPNKTLNTPYPEYMRRYTFNDRGITKKATDDTLINLAYDEMKQTIANFPKHSTAEFEQEAYKIIEKRFYKNCPSRDSFAQQVKTAHISLQKESDDSHSLGIVTTIMLKEAECFSNKGQ